MRVVAYLRVSTAEQADRGHGLDVQRRALRAWARANGHRVVAWTEDAGHSGALPAQDRPGLTEALRTLRDRRADGLAVYELDRLAREVTVQEAVLAEAWRRAGAEVHTPHGLVPRDDPDDPYRTAMRQMAGVFAGLERRLVVKRMRDGRAAKAARGGHAVGAYRYGSGPDGPILAEREALAHMLALRAAGASTRAIAAALTERGYPTRRGGLSWSAPTVARILARELESPTPATQLEGAPL